MSVACIGKSDFLSFDQICSSLMILLVIKFKNIDFSLGFPFLLSNYVVKKVKFQAEPSHNSNVGFVSDSKCTILELIKKLISRKRKESKQKKNHNGYRSLNIKELFTVSRLERLARESWSCKSSFCFILLNSRFYLAGI